ncbi:MAG: DUF4321 domain-containing protein [Oscillospiraceae bacterium]|jgi:hypothetical protein|nr:DUF4321 domain-containing protein [Oscillospiraceae bacterium]
MGKFGKTLVLIVVIVAALLIGRVTAEACATTVPFLAKTAEFGFTPFVLKLVGNEFTLGLQFNISIAQIIIVVFSLYFFYPKAVRAFSA